MLPGDVLIPEHLELDPIRVEAVLEVALVIAPPILDPLEGDRLALLHLAKLIGAGHRQQLPVVRLDPVGGDLDGVAGGRAEGQGFQQILATLGRAAGDGQGVVIKLGHLAYLGAVVVVVPGVVDLLAAQQLEGEQPVIGGDRLAVRPACLGIDAQIEGLVVRPEGPFVGQHRHGIAGDGMGAQERQVGLPHIAGEAAVGVRAVYPQGQRKTGHEAAKGAAPLGGRIRESGIRVVALPRQIGWQGGAPAVVAQTEDQGNGTGAQKARDKAGAGGEGRWHVLALLMAASCRPLAGGYSPDGGWLIMESFPALVNGDGQIRIR